MSRVRTVLVFLALVSVCQGVAPAQGASPKEKPLATAGAIVVRSGEFEAFVRAEVSKSVQELGVEERRTELEKLVVRKALAAEAERRGYGEDQRLRDALLQWKIRSYPEHFFAKSIDVKATVKAEEIQAYLNPQDSYLLSAMVFPAGEEGEAEAREAHRLLAAGADFAETARSRSHGLSASRGGDLGWQTVPGPFLTGEDAEVIRSATVGRFTEPFASEVGWVVYLVRDRLTVAQIIEKEGDTARRELLAMKVGALRREKQQELRAKAKISYPEGAGQPAAIVNGAPIYRSSLAIEQAGEGSRHNFSFANVSTEKQRLERFIDAILVVQETERIGLDKDPGLSQPLAIMRINTLSEMAVRAKVPAKIALSDAEMRAAYRDYYLPEIYRLQIIHSRKRATVEAALKDVRGGEEFKAVAERYNDGWLKESGGVLPEGNIAEYPREAQRAIAALPVGGVSEVLPLGSGFVILKVLGKRTVPVPPYEDVAEALASRLTLRRRADMIRDLVTKERQKLDIRIDEEQLARL